MDCQIKRNSQGKIVEVAGNNPTFKNILNNTPTLSLEEAIEVYKHTLKSPELIKKAIERNNGNPLSLAPNGKPSLLYQSYIDLGYNAQEAERLTAQVYSDEFKAWFGDWQNSPKEASKVVDSNGMPLVVYHASRKSDNTFSEFDGLDVRRTNFNTLKDEYYKVSFFAEDYSYSNELYGGNIRLFFLNIKNPKEIEGFNMDSNEVVTILQDEKKDLVYDGFFGKERGLNTMRSFSQDKKSFATLNSNQIKSATDNIGTFSNETNDIRFQTAQENTIPPAKEIEEQLINTLKKNGLSTNVVLLNTNEINKKLQELGVNAETRKQITAWHGSPYSFDRLMIEGEIKKVEC
jgi:hypothetical protein